MSYRLVDGEEQIAGGDHRIAQAGAYGLRAQLSPGFLGAPARLIDQAATRGVIPTGAARWRKAVARREAPGRLVDGGDRESRLHARARLRDARAIAAGEKPLLARRQKCRKTEIDPGVAGGGVHGQQKIGLVGDGNLERIDPDRRLPARLDAGKRLHDNFARLDWFNRARIGERRLHAGQNRGARKSRGAVKSPAAAAQHAQAKAGVGALPDILEPVFARPQKFAPRFAEPDVDVIGAGSFEPRRSRCRRGRTTPVFRAPGRPTGFRVFCARPSSWLLSRARKSRSIFAAAPPKPYSRSRLAIHPRG